MRPLPTRTRLAALAIVGVDALSALACTDTPTVPTPNLYVGLPVVITDTAMAFGVSGPVTQVTTSALDRAAATAADAAATTTVP